MQVHSRMCGEKLPLRIIETKPSVKPLFLFTVLDVLCLTSVYTKQQAYNLSCG